MIDELNRKREQIAKYDRSSLEMMAVVALKKLAANIVPGHTKMKKQQLIDSLLAATKAERVLAVIIPDTPITVIAENYHLTKRVAENVNQDLAVWTKSLYQDFRNVVQGNYRNGDWDENIHGDIAAIGYRVVRFLDGRDGEQSDGGLAFTTKLRYRTHVCNLLTDMVDSEAEAPHYKQLKFCLELLLKQIKFQLVDLSDHKKGLQERRLAQRKLEKVIVDFEPLHTFAVDVLSKVNTLKPSYWKAVAIALAVATGRRMAEIHRSSTTFEYVSQWHCNFTGQLKVKGDAEEFFSSNPAYTIPTLVDAQLVCEAHQWLKDNGKTVTDSKVAANRYTKDLSDEMKLLRRRFNVNHSFFTYKGLRTIYAQACNTVFNRSDPDNTLFLAQILGHGRGELLRHDNLTDMLTPQSYNSDFVVVNVESCINL